MLNSDAELSPSIGLGELLQIALKSKILIEWGNKNFMKKSVPSLSAKWLGFYCRLPVKNTGCLARFDWSRGDISSMGRAPQQFLSNSICILKICLWFPNAL